MLGSIRRTWSLRVQHPRKDRQPQHRPACAGMDVPQKGTTKTIHVMRHGQTEMNVYLSRVEPDGQSSPSFEDPLLFDTKLTPQGEIGAREAGAAAKALEPPPDIVISSPLSRALHTADLAFDGIPSPRLVLSLARERTYFASDVGVKRPREFSKGAAARGCPSYEGKAQAGVMLPGHRAQGVIQEGLGSELSEKWPGWSFEGVRDEVWWLDHCDDKSSTSAIVKEPEERFKARMEALKKELRSRPEPCIALVTHRDVIESLVGLSPANCELRTIQL